jgi:hypothetical protein
VEHLAEPAILIQKTKEKGFVRVNTIKLHLLTFDFFTLYTTNPHSKLKESLKNLVQLVHKREWPT